MFICVARTSIEWDAFLQGARRALGRSVTRSLDEEHLPLAGVPSFVCAISEFAKPGDHAWTQMRTDVGAMRHSGFTFLVNLPRAEFVMLASFGLVVTPADEGDFALVSSSLAGWVQAVVDASNRKSLRPFACLLLAWFERENLGEAWGSWEKDHIPSERMYRLVKK